MELPEPYHSLPIRDWLAYMRKHKASYSTRSLRAWLRQRHKNLLGPDDGASEISYGAQKPAEKGYLTDLPGKQRDKRGA